MKNILKVSAFATIALIMSGCDGSLQKEMVANQMDDINTQVVNDSIEQYNITKSSGNPIDICVHAGMVKAAVLQAKDEAQYKEWNEIEKADCAAAGMPK